MGSEWDGAPRPSDAWYDIARDLWSFVYGGDIPAVLRRLGELYDDQLAECERAGSESDPPAPLPARRTLYDWPNRYGWAEWRDRTFRSSLPGIHRANMIDLAAGTREAFATVRALARGEHAGTALQERNRLQASLALLDRAGYSPRHRAAGEHTPDLAELAGNIALSPEAIAALIAGALPSSDDISQEQDNVDNSVDNSDSDDISHISNQVDDADAW